MPAMIRLAAIAGNRNWMISQSIALLLPSFRKCRDEQIDVEVEELDVVLRAGLASTDGAMVSTVAPFAPAICLGVFESKCGSMMMTFTCCRFISAMRSMMCDGEGGSRLGFHMPDHVQAEPVREVRPRPVIRDHLRALVGRHRGIPAALGHGQPLVEVVVALGEGGLSAGSSFVRRSRIARAIARPFLDRASSAGCRMDERRPSRG